MALLTFAHDNVILHSLRTTIDPDDEISADLSRNRSRFLDRSQSSPYIKAIEFSNYERMSTLTRLHVTPLTPDTLPAILGPSLAQVATDISYQTIKTFPENSYGFLELPQADAKKLTIKLNGAILKGRKMKIEEARPRKRRHTSAEDEADIEQQPVSVSKPHRSNNEKNTVQGHELSPDRKVKRGWTKPKRLKSSGSKEKNLDTHRAAEKSQPPSKYTEKEEMLFNTKVPKNKRPIKSEKSKKNETVSPSSVLVHEFENTTIQPSFLRDIPPKNKKTAKYVENVGWLDDDGNVVELEMNVTKIKKRPVGLNLDLGKNESRLSRAPMRPPKRVSQNPAIVLSTSNDTSHDAMDRSPDGNLTNDTSSSGSSSEAETESIPSQASDESSSGSPVSQEQQNSAIPAKIHPLEALFKKPKHPNGSISTKPSLEVETGFSFFDEAASEHGDDLPPMPSTPFTSQDIHQRGIRSAAPTPDTAHPSRFNSFVSALGDHSEESSNNEDVVPDEEGKASTPLQQRSTRSQSEFEKRFWAERGQNNRAWKTRSRTARKEQRQAQRRPHRRDAD